MLASEFGERYRRHTFLSGFGDLDFPLEAGDSVQSFFTTREECGFLHRFLHSVSRVGKESFFFGVLVLCLIPGLGVLVCLNGDGRS